MNIKIERIVREIEKTRVKITEAQERLRDLERQKTDLENTEIVTLYRSANIAPGELAEVIRAYRANGSLAPVAAAAPVAASRRENGFSAEPEGLEDNSDE